jgi:hypothetical protein
VNTPKEALAFVRKHGVVLEAGRGPVPNLADAIAGKPISGSWWGHAKGRLIFRLTRAVRDSEDVLVCRLVCGKITYVHRRMWPSIVCAAPCLNTERLAALREVHTASGAHRLITAPFPQWVPADARAGARQLSIEDAIRQIGDWVQTG